MDKLIYIYFAGLIGLLLLTKSGNFEKKTAEQPHKQNSEENHNAQHENNIDNRPDRSPVRRSRKPRTAGQTDRLRPVNRDPATGRFIGPGGSANGES